MFSWVVKVVPQPPEKPGLGEEDKNNAQEAKAPVNEDAAKQENPVKPNENEASEENSGVLTWLSHGFTSALPQPVATQKANSEVKEENGVSNSKTGEEPGVIGWIVQGLGKVVPQPDDKYKQQTDSQEVTEVPQPVPEVKVPPAVPQAVPEVKVQPAVHDAKDLADAEPLPQIPVVEVISDEEPDADDKALTPSVMDWLKQGFEKVVPQPSPVHSPVHTPEPPKKEIPDPEPLAPPSVSAPAPSPVDPPKAEEGTKGGSNENGESNMVGWIVQGLSRIVPQPVVKAKEEASDAVQSRERHEKTP